ncbi:MAG: ArgR family transcriptional regulator [Muribaculaceae bacterium]|nr:ArgR family transcriptional regulator [Muribaculaceae bacterium]
MKNKKSRLQQIVELINNNCIGSQEELSKMLSTKGFMVTQATLSRDLKMLRITKVATDTGGYMYIIPDSNNIQDKLLQSGQMIQKNHSASFVSINFSQNIAVIKTRNGYASGLAYDIDMSKTPEILGTIAGADTVFAILREDVTHEQALQVFAKFLPITIEPI